MKYAILLMTVRLSLPLTLMARVLTVGNGASYANLEDAAPFTLPGDILLFRNGSYAGDQFVHDLKGKPGQNILLLAETSGRVIITGGTVAWHFTNVEYLHISGFIFSGQTGNGLNVDDGQDYSSPSHHITIANCTFRDIQANGNNDLLKLSGLDSFTIASCHFENGAAKGSGIDLVGCHAGLITNSRFENLGSNSIQIKGGSARIEISKNYFKNGGVRTLNLGGSTSLPYFRPLDAPYEAAHLEVYANIIIGSGAAIAYVGAIDVKVVNNTIVYPQDWVIRILQETVDPKRFPACGDNFFQNNLIYYGPIKTEVNIGAHTRPESFTFSGNLWYYSLQPNRLPDLPVADALMITGQDPLFINLEGEDFQLRSGSPAKARIEGFTTPILDFNDREFRRLRAIGAVEF